MELVHLSLSAIALIQPGKEQAQLIVGVRNIGREFSRARQMLLGLVVVTLRQVQLSQ